MVVDQNQAFGLPIESEVSQIFLPSEESGRTNPLKTLNELGSPTPLELNPNFT